MQVTAFSTPTRPEWRWRIVDYAGTLVEESSAGFATIAAAVAEGAERLRRMDRIDTSQPAPIHRWAVRRPSGPRPLG
jgi:hypothetical protein